MQKMIYILLLGILVFVAFQSFMPLSVSKVEKQAYRVVQKENEYEIRYYPPAVLATTRLSAKTYKELANNGFRKIAGYIFGNNESSAKISMTSPVHMDINDNNSSMSFVMPSAYKLKDLPRPKDPRIELHETSGEYVAAIQFSGFASDEKIKKYAEQLRTALLVKKITTTGNYRYLGYNPPFQLIGRKNEIIVAVEWTKVSNP